jgi:hypothetical protein
MLLVSCLAVDELCDSGELYGVGQAMWRRSVWV